MLRLLLVLLFACGSKTGLPSASLDHARPDAGFDTFPCRWSYFGAVPLGRDGAFEELRGAVSAVGPTALVSTEDATWMIDVRDVPSVRERGLAVAAAVTAADGRFEMITAGACAARSIDFSGVLGPVMPFAERPCAGGETVGGALPLVVAEAPPQVIRWQVGRRPTPFGRLPFGAHVRASVAMATRAVVALDGGLMWRAEDGAGAAFATVSGEIMGMATDRLRGGIVLTTRAPDRLVTYDASGAERDVVRLPNTPSTGLATNETEALFMTTDGRLGFVPLDGRGDARFLEPVEETREGVFVRGRPVIVDGGSAGGRLYVVEQEGVSTLSFRTMVCNR